MQPVILPIISTNPLYNSSMDIECPIMFEDNFATLWYGFETRKYDKVSEKLIGK